jgi:hydroxypyruvate isomerase
VSDPLRFESKSTSSDRLSRRQVLRAAGVAAGAALAGRALAADKPSGGKAVTRGRIKQSIVHWCFQDHWDVEQTCRVARQLGCESVELVDPKHWPTLKRHGLVCAIAGIDMSPDEFPFLKGFNNPSNWPRVVEATKKSIDACAEFGFPSVIAFTGMRENIPDDVGLKNCVEGFKKVIGYAEQKKVDICLEMLNTRDDSHPMKGHPGYQGDSTEYCVEIIKKVGSPRMKLLFDVYHVQIMDGDVIRRIRQHKEHIGHVHTAGNPGRGELDDAQEINYKPVMEALVEIGYKGYVGQEFIPTRDPLTSLREAIAICDV